MLSEIVVDDRKELDDPAVDAIARRQARSVAAVIPASRLDERADGSFVLAAATLADRYQVAADERFRDQPVATHGTAFLIAPRLLATAAHVVIAADALHRLCFVFGFSMNGGKASTVFPAQDVHTAKSVWLDRERDLAVLTLDRPVAQREPLVLRWTAGVRDGEPLYLIGHPVGLPAKLADNGTVRGDGGGDFFETDLDAMASNSGSPVFSATARDVVGVLTGAPFGFVSIGGKVISRFGHGEENIPVTVARIANLPVRG
jgi:S1-C subfamily serine protease